MTERAPAGQVTRNQLLVIGALVVALVLVVSFQLRGGGGSDDTGIGVPQGTTTTSTLPPTTWTLPAEPRDPFATR